MCITASDPSSSHPIYNTRRAVITYGGEIPKIPESPPLWTMSERILTQCAWCKDWGRYNHYRCISHYTKWLFVWRLLKPHKRLLYPCMTSVKIAAVEWCISRRAVIMLGYAWCWDRCAQHYHRSPLPHGPIQKTHPWLVAMATGFQSCELNCFLILRNGKRHFAAQKVKYLGLLIRTKAFR